MEEYTEAGPSLADSMPNGSASPEKLVAEKDERDSPFNQSLGDITATLLVALYACLSSDDWTALLPHIWRRYDETSANLQSVCASPRSSKRPLHSWQMTFLIMKCGEIIPSQLKNLVMSDIKG